MILLITPENDVYFNPKYPSLFLGGSIENGLAEDWQSKVIDQLKKSNIDVNVYNPRRSCWDSSWIQEKNNQQFSYQVNWELSHLDKSDIIFMYLSPGTNSIISMLELGLYLRYKTVVVCCPNGYCRKGNVDIVCERFGVGVFDDLNKAVDYTVNLIPKVLDSNTIPILKDVYYNDFYS